ncbi:MAG: hypothetical protein JW888_01610 [Pirellulales bacterium]|nr:hypothetical protein [Pirellulales bacterium]
MNRFGSSVVCCSRMVACYAHAARATGLQAPARRPWYRAARLAFALALIFFAAAKGVPAQSVWELTPYRIRLIVAYTPTASLNQEAVSHLERSLLDRVETTVGAGWDVVPMEPSPRLRHRMMGDLAALTLEDLPEDTLKFDKVLLLAIAPDVSGYQVRARELDVRTRVFGPIVQLPVWQPAKLCGAAFHALFESFTPLARVVSTVKKEVTLRLRAGGLPVRDPTLRRVQPGDVFQPMMRYDDRAGNLRKIIPVPWTFLVVDQCDSEAFRCTLHSAMLSPMSGRRRGRVDPLALAVRPAGTSTRVVLKGRVEPKPLLAGYDIYEQALNSKKTTLLGKTDVDGGIRVGRGAHPLRLLVVKSGKVLLARLPVVPGLMSVETAEIRDDDQRLEAEGFITAMQLNLLDVVTRQKILLQRGRKYLAEGKLDLATKQVEELRELPRRSDLLRQLENKQDKVVVEDRWTKTKVDELFNDTRKLLEKHLVSEPIDVLDRDVAAAKKKSPAKTKPSQ